MSDSKPKVLVLHPSPDNPEFASAWRRNHQAWREWATAQGAETVTRLLEEGGEAWVVGPAVKDPQLEGQARALVERGVVVRDLRHLGAFEQPYPSGGVYGSTVKSAWHPDTLRRMLSKMWVG